MIDISQCKLDSQLLRETNDLAKETSGKVDEVSAQLSTHLLECCRNQSAISMLSKHVGELIAGAEIGEAKVDAIAKRVGESIAATLDPMRQEQVAMRRRMARLRNFGAAIAVVTIAASTVYMETKGKVEVAQKASR